MTEGHSVRHRIRDLNNRTSEEAFSLVEVIIAMFVFAVAVLGLASVAMSSILSLRHTRDREQATNSASAVIEEVRSRDFTAIFLDATDPGVTALPTIPGAVHPDPKYCFEGEPIVDDAVAPAAGVTAIPHVQSRGNDGIVEVTTYVTYAQEADANPTSCDLTTDVDRDIKRVVTVAQWEDRDGLRQVRQESLVTSAGRGLPVPDFDLTPAAASMSLHIDDTTTSPTKEVCARHQLRNLGASDTYDWALVSVDGAATGPFRLNSSQYETPNGKWTVRAFMQFPATTNSSTPPDPASDATTVLMTDSDGIPPNRPESPLAVAPGESANFWFCYQPKQGTLSVGDTITARLEIHSRFDANRFEELAHTLTITDQSDVFYLYDRLDSTAHDRDSDPRSHRIVYPTMTMGPEDGIVGSTDNLGTVDYSDRSLSDWDQDVDANQLPGLRLIRGNSQLDFAAWHEGFLSETTLEANATLSLYVSTTEALLGGVDELDAATHQAQSLQITLARLDRHENVPGTQLASFTVNYVQDRAGWVRLDIPVSFGSSVTFANNEFLRLRVACDPASVSDCHLGYDNTGLASGLEVGIL